MEISISGCSQCPPPPSPPPPPTPPPTPSEGAPSWKPKPQKEAGLGVLPLYGTPQLHNSLPSPGGGGGGGGDAPRPDGGPNDVDLRLDNQQRCYSALRGRCVTGVFEGFVNDKNCRAARGWAFVSLCSYRRRYLCWSTGNPSQCVKRFVIVRRFAISRTSATKS